MEDNSDYFMDAEEDNTKNNQVSRSAAKLADSVFHAVETKFSCAMSLLGIQFAPLDLPMERRLQTLAAAAWIGMLAFGELASVVLAVYLMRTDYYWLMLLYVAHIAKNRDSAALGHGCLEWARNWRWWEYFRDYFPLKLVKTTELDPKKNYLFCVFPHGVLSTGCFFSFATNASGFKELFPGMKSHMVSLGGHFLVPFFRELVIWLGMVSASLGALTELLDVRKGAGRCVALVVGGAAESLNCHPGEYKVVLRRRKGFIKLAMKNGVALVPVFSFGETELYSQLSNPEGGRVRRLQEWFRRSTGIAPVVPMGRGILQYSVGLVPRRRPVTTVVGEPMEVERNFDPTNEEIDKVHAEFMQRLVDMFEEGKHKYLSNPKQTRLVIE